MPVPGFLTSFADKAQAAVNASPLAGHLPTTGNDQPSGFRGGPFESIQHQLRALGQQYTCVYSCLGQGDTDLRLVLRPLYRGSSLRRRVLLSILTAFLKTPRPKAKNYILGANLKLKTSKTVGVDDDMNVSY